MHRIDETFSRYIAGQHLDQATFLQILADDEGGQQGQAEAAEHGLGEGLVIVDAQGAGNRDRDIAVVAIQVPDALGVHEGVVEAVVQDQVLGGQRNAAAGEVSGARADLAANRCQLPGDEVLAGFAGDAQRDVVTFVGQVDQAVADGQVDGQVGIAGHEIGQRRGDVHGAESHRRTDFQFAARFLVQARNGRVGQAQLFQYAVAMLEKCLADIGQAQAARAPVQQAHTQVALQTGNGLAHPRLGDIEATCCFGKTAYLDHVSEEQHVVDVVHDVILLLSKWKQFCSNSVTYQALIPTLLSLLPNTAELLSQENL